MRMRGRDQFTPSKPARKPLCSRPQKHSCKQHRRNPSLQTSSCWEERVKEILQMNIKYKTSGGDDNGKTQSSLCGLGVELAEAGRADPTRSEHHSKPLTGLNSGLLTYIPCAL